MEKRIRILLVDDDPDQLRLFQRLLEKENYDVISVSSGQEGFQKLRESPVDIILADIAMPEMTGLEFAAELYEQSSQIPIVLMTTGSELMKMPAKSYRVSAFCLKRELIESLPVILGSPLTNCILGGHNAAN